MHDSMWVTVAQADVPAPEAWAGAREMEAIVRCATPRRRADWIAGRWAARQAVAGLIGETPGLEILTGSDGAPEAWCGGEPVEVAVSITHRAGFAAALACPGRDGVGCDLELVERRTRAFAADWFTASELVAVEHAPAADRDLMVTLIWSAKESALKATRLGLTVDTRRIDVRPSGVSDGWRPFVACMDGNLMHGWWRHDGSWVMTAIARVTAKPPTFAQKTWSFEEKK